MPLWTSVSILPQAVIRKISAHTKSPRERVLSGSAVMLTGLGAATLINFGYNIAVARYLGPIAFGHTTAVYTLLILISSVTLSFQILTAKIVAQQRSSEEQSKAYREFHWRGWAAGAVVSMLLLIFRDGITAYLNLPNPILIVLLAIGTAFYVPLGTRRGYLQGVCDFRRLAHNLVLEGLCRLTGSLLLIRMGLGVTGVIGANAAAVAIVYFAARPKLTILNDRIPEVPIAFRESLQAAIFFAGQVVINNCDIVVVKHFFPSEQAGIYAAVAMVGRVVFAFSWAVVSSMFPIAAETESRKQDDRGVLGTSLLIVSGICLAFMCGLRIAPSAIWTHLFGSQFGTVTGSNFRYLLVLYALSAGIYCMSVVLIAYEMSRKIANTGSVQLIIAGAVVAGIYRFHSSLAEVIWVQVAMMVVLLLCVAVPFVAPLLAGSNRSRLSVPGLVRLRSGVSEHEVIAEFLKNDFESPEFAQYRYTLERLVAIPDIEDDEQNSVRRALFNVRHGQLWRELPNDTQWFEAEIRADDLDRLQVFPRAQWRKLALGDYGLPQIAQRVLDERHRQRAPEAFLDKIDDLRAHLKQDVVGGAVLLIGINESGPFTILDGNHRLVAAMLTSHDSLKRFRFFCGLSPRMAQCCWHRTNVMTLMHYGANMVRYFVHSPEAELVRLLHRSEGASAEAT
jgi:O-antigen/teichoic acid export membrane protein